MKYIYYIIGIMVVFSGLAAYGIFDTKIEISKPFLTINDRVISDSEFKKMLHNKPHHMTQEQFIEEIIEKQLFIQESVKMDINKEKSFRLSVQNFYEQSLIKILLDRKQDSFKTDVTNEEIAKYKTAIQNTFFLTKMVYPSMKDAQNKTNETIEKIEDVFLDLSSDLKFIVMDLKVGEVSKPIANDLTSMDFQVYIYKLDKIQKIEDSSKIEDFDIEYVSLYIKDKKKEQLMNEWSEEIRKKAKIWRKNE